MHARFYNIIMAFHSFAGMPLKITDAAPTIDEETYEAVERFLSKCAEFAANNANDEFPELATLARAIKTKLAR